MPPNPPPTRPPNSPRSSSGVHPYVQRSQPTPVLAEAAIAKFKRRSAVVGVLGLGYVGLDLACTFAESGLFTLAFDTDGAKVQQLQRGNSYVKHVPTKRIRALVDSNRLRPTNEFSGLDQCDAAILSVPTPLTGGGAPDLTFVTGATECVAEHLHLGQLVVLESTTYPGTTEELLRQRLEAAGLRVGIDFFLAFSPERIDLGNSSSTGCQMERVVGGVTSDCLQVATAAYEQICKRVIPVSSPRVAEAAKLLENIYRCVNVAMINEFKVALERMNVDIWEVVAASSTKPFGFTPFYPGPGVGGHCIPIDPVYFTWKARQCGFAARLIETAIDINRAMPSHVVGRLREALRLQRKALRLAKILILGVAYKRDVEDVRESPAISIVKALQKEHASISYHDPYVPQLSTHNPHHQYTSVPLVREHIRAADAVVIVTDHSNINYQFVLDHANLIVDTRNVTTPFRKPHHRVITA